MDGPGRAGPATAGLGMAGPVPGVPAGGWELSGRSSSDPARTAERPDRPHRNDQVLPHFGGGRSRDAQPTNGRLLRSSCSGRCRSRSPAASDASSRPTDAHFAPATAVRGCRAGVLIECSAHRCARRGHQTRDGRCAACGPRTPAGLFSAHGPRTPGGPFSAAGPDMPGGPFLAHGPHRLGGRYERAGRRKPDGQPAAGDPRTPDGRYERAGRRKPDDQPEAGDPRTPGGRSERVGRRKPDDQPGAGGPHKPGGPFSAPCPHRLGGRSERVGRRKPDDQPGAGGLRTPGGPFSAPCPHRLGGRYERDRHHKPDDQPEAGGLHRSGGPFSVNGPYTRDDQPAAGGLHTPGGQCEQADRDLAVRCAAAGHRRCGGRYPVVAGDQRTAGHRRRVAPQYRRSGRSRTHSAGLDNPGRHRRCLFDHRMDDCFDRIDRRAGAGHFGHLCGPCGHLLPGIDHHRGAARRRAARFRAPPDPCHQDLSLQLHCHVVGYQNSIEPETAAAALEYQKGEVQCEEFRIGPPLCGNVVPAATYSPTPWRVQYHRRTEA